MTLEPENNVGETGEDFLLRASDDNPSTLFWAHRGAGIAITGPCSSNDPRFTLSMEFGPTDCYLHSAYEQDTSGPYSVRDMDVIATSYTAVVVAVGQKQSMSA